MAATVALVRLYETLKDGSFVWTPEDVKKYIGADKDTIVALYREADAKDTFPASTRYYNFKEFLIQVWDASRHNIPLLTSEHQLVIRSRL